MTNGDESIPFTMQAALRTVAVAPELPELPDGPDMIRIPVTVNVIVPTHLLVPPKPPARLHEREDRSHLPNASARRRRTRFDNTCQGAVEAVTNHRETHGPEGREKDAAFRRMLAIIRRPSTMPVAEPT